MASITKRPNGRKTVQFVAPDGRRKSIRLGKVSLRAAEAVKLKVEHLVAATVTRHALDAETARWVIELGDDLANKLAKVGLIPKRAGMANNALGEFLDLYLAGRAHLKPNTLRNCATTRRLLVDHLGEDRLLSEITPGDADQWREDLINSGLGGPTVSREVKRARQFFRAAMRKRLITENPFTEVRGGKQVNQSRYHFITHEVAQKVIAACPDAQWRLIFVLARYGGLRCPSEVLALTWRDIDWELARIRVRSPKTEHHDGGESRVIPLFPELRKHLDDVFEQAEPATEYVITQYRQANVNLRSRLLDIIWAAGLKPWPKLFQNLRSTRETELTKQFPMHVVCRWIGNSAPVAAKHYLQVTDEHFEQASQPPDNPVQNPVQSAHVTANQDSSRKTKTLAFAEKSEGWPVVNTYSVPPRGVEPLSSD